MLPLPMDRAARHESASQDGILERAEGVLLLTAFALATVGWCSFLAVALWRASSWFFDPAG
jgi:hypothetical protein